MSLAAALKSAGKEKEAEEAMSKAAELTPNDPQELVDLGKVWAKKENAEKATHYFKLALDHSKASKEDVELYEDIINSLFEIGKLKEAIPLINTVADERPDLYNLLGLAYVKNGEYPQGIAAYSKALQNDITGERYAYLHNRGMAHDKAGDKEKAKKDFSDAYAAHPNPATAKMLESLGVDASTIKSTE